ncbi:hypothetical protein [Simkania sp.]|uniref:hypothetical protein n=1 Tax=Simkania sp. TaxID=34094 RepID=UPI003B5287BB
MKKITLALLLTFTSFASLHALTTPKEGWSCSVCMRVNQDDKPSCEYAVILGNLNSVFISLIHGEMVLNRN